MKNKQTCEKCKENVDDLWLWQSDRKDGSIKEIWICEDCAKKHIKDFEKILEKVNEIENTK